jgi:anti-sigma factor RsiW
MDCKFTEKISSLMDGELSDAEARQLQLHLPACPNCRQAQADFHLLRQEIQDYRSAVDLGAQRRLLDNLLNDAAPLRHERVPFWRRRIALPVPALAVMALLFMALSLWAIYPRTTQPPQQSFVIPPAKTDRGPEANPFDLSRFDKGGRAVIYTARRAAANEQPRKEGNR